MSGIVCDRENYTAEAEKPPRDRNVYKDINFKEKFLQELVETSNSLLKNLRNIVVLQRRNLNILVLSLRRPQT